MLQKPKKKEPAGGGNVEHGKLCTWIDENLEDIVLSAETKRLKSKTALAPELPGATSDTLDSNLRSRIEFLFVTSTRTKKESSTSESASADVHMASGMPMPAEADMKQCDLVADLKDSLKHNAAAFVCGAGVSKSLCSTCPMWRELIDRLALRAKESLGANDRWMRDVTSVAMPAASDRIQKSMAVNAPTVAYKSLV